MINWIKTKLKKAWKWIVGLFVVGVAVAQIAGIPPDTLDDELVSVFDSIQVYQDQVFIDEGKYIQFMNAGDFDGTTKKNWNKATKPLDLDRDWTVVGGLPTETFVSYQVNVYSGSQGQGYTVIAEYDDAGVTYRKFRHFGPETWRDAGEDKWAIKRESKLLNE